MRVILIILGGFIALGLAGSQTAQAADSRIARLYTCEALADKNPRPFGRKLTMALKGQFTENSTGYSLILMTEIGGPYLSTTYGTYVNRPGRGGGKRYEFTMKEDINDPGFRAYVKHDLYWGETQEGLLMVYAQNAEPYSCVLIK